MIKIKGEKHSCATKVSPVICLVYLPDDQIFPSLGGSFWKHQDSVFQPHIFYIEKISQHTTNHKYYKMTLFRQTGVVYSIVYSLYSLSVILGLFRCTQG